MYRCLERIGSSEVEVRAVVPLATAPALAWRWSARPIIRWCLGCWRGGLVQRVVCTGGMVPSSGKSLSGDVLRRPCPLLSLSPCGGGRRLACGAWDGSPGRCSGTSLSAPVRRDGHFCGSQSLMVMACRLDARRPVFLPFLQWGKRWSFMAGERRG